MNGLFNNPDFYPTPENIIFRMLSQFDVDGKTILEPSAGKGDLLTALTNAGADVLYCEISEPLQRILNGTGRFMCSDFLELKSEQVSHIHAIFMNPPFSKGVEHILHAFNIAPAGCFIVALCNSSTIENDYSKDRKQLKSIIELCGAAQNLGKCFDDAERKTGVSVSLITISKEGNNSTEFDGFFMEDEPEENEEEPALIKYNVIRDLVGRYVDACKIYDSQLSAAVQMNNTLSGFYGKTLAFSCTEDGKPKLKSEFKKDLQREAWNYIFEKLDIKRDMTRGVRETLNKFIEQQTEIPFTMRNIYKMLEIIIATRGQTMDKAIEEAFNRITEHHHENRHNIKGWKTNLHYLIGKKFILPYIINPAKEYGYTSDSYNSMKNGFDGSVPDLEKALCFIMGDKYTDIKTVNCSINRNNYGVWYSSHYFKYKGYKNGNMHFEFISVDVWEKLNQRIAKIKGYPLYEKKTQTAYQSRNAGSTPYKKREQAEILFSVNI